MNNTAKTGLIIGIVALIIQILIMVDISNDGKFIAERLLPEPTRKSSIEVEHNQLIEFYTTMVQKEPSKPGWSVIEISNKYNELPTGNYSKHEAILKKINGKIFIIHDDKCKYCKEKEE